MKLTESQYKHLRRLGHDLKPIVMIGGGGLTDTVLAEIDSSLSHHELIKVRIRAGDRKERDDTLNAVIDAVGAQRIQRIGNVALLYRPAEEPKLVLPAG